MLQKKHEEMVQQNSSPCDELVQDLTKPQEKTADHVIPFEDEVDMKTEKGDAPGTKITDQRAGWLVFKSESGISVSAVYVPFTETDIIQQLRASSSKEFDIEIVNAFHEWEEKNAGEMWYRIWECEVLRENLWPFNKHRLIGTFHLAIS